MKMMKLLKTLNLGFFLCPLVLLSFQNITTDYKQFEGGVIDKETGKPLVFATLTVENSNISTITNTEGDFVLKVPLELLENNLVVSFLGYTPNIIAIKELSTVKNSIALKASIVQLTEVDVNAPKDARVLVERVFLNKGDNYFNSPTVMTAFYRETIKKRRKNVSLSEAVVNVYKTPYYSNRRDALQLYKARKSTDYDKLDTIALKLQGGPYNTLYTDLIKYPDIVFIDQNFDDYNFKFERSTRVNNNLVYVISFEQKKSILEPLYKGELFINVENQTLTSAVYELNITNREMASRLFVRRKPAKVDVWPTNVAYRVDYRSKNGKWYYGYSNVYLEFKVDWEDKLFNSVYSMTAEMAVTDWNTNTTNELPKNKERIRTSIILADEASGFSDPEFWGEYNIIEPEKSIESAIKKIQRQLRRAERKNAAKPIP